MYRLMLWIGLLTSLELAAEPVGRCVLALYDGHVYEDPYFTKVHQVAEMPLNHLGLIVEYVDVQKPLPDLKDRKDVIGLIAWFPKYFDLEDPKAFIDWVSRAMDEGRKCLMMSAPSFYSKKKKVPNHIINAFWEKLGLNYTGEFWESTFEVELKRDNPKIFPFERDYVDPIPHFPLMEVIDPECKVSLWAEVQGKKYPLIITGPNGAWVSEDLALKENISEHFRKWYFNPFEFFREVYQTDQIPKGDTTTLMGRRIFYSHIDGDGWNSVTQIEGFQEEKVLCSQVIQREILNKYPELPVTCAVIGADMDLNWVGTEEGIKTAREIFNLPNIEPASHTYSHPFFWQYFQNYTPEKEAALLYKYPFGGFETVNLWKKLKYKIRDETPEQIIEKKDEFKDWSAEELKLLTSGYQIPRAFANKPFNLHLEVVGAIDILKPLLPENKKIALYQWSGDTKPFKAVFEVLQPTLVPNLNGGDTRFDNAFDSYGWVSPLGRNVDGYRQIYCSASNENTYTDLWTKDFWGFSLLPQTWERTDFPLRVKPINLYYHMYSGENSASLNSLKKNLEALNRFEFIAIKASEFANLVQGFYDAKYTWIKPNELLVENRGSLQTVRFDRSSDTEVDFAKSKGVLGQKRLYGSLYVALDPEEKEPLIVFAKSTKIEPHLLESNWIVKKLTRETDRFSFKAQGWGRGVASFQVKSGRWKVKRNGAWLDQVVSKEGRLDLLLGKGVWGESDIVAAYEGD